MKSIRISDYSYEFLKEQSQTERRSITKMLDYLIDIFRDENKLAQQGLQEKTNRKDIQRN